MARDRTRVCIKALKDQRVHSLRADIFSFTQKPPVTTRKYDYHMECDSVAVAHTASFQDWWDKLPQETRKNVRRSQKRGVVVTLKELDDELCRGLVDLNNDSSIRQGKRYTHFGKSLDQVKEDQCAAKGISWLTFGMFNYGNKRESSLREFKIRNGFEEVLVPRYYAPLSVKGAVCMRLGLHRGLVGMLPHSLIVLGTKAREKLYTVKQSIGRCSSMVEQSNRNRQTGCSNPPAGSNT